MRDSPSIVERTMRRRQCVLASCDRSAGACTTSDSSSARHARPGFSMIELLVVIGVILVLLGLIVPVLGRSVEQARLTADLATIRSNTSLVMQYADQNQGAYPLAGDLRCEAFKDWATPLVEASFFSTAGDADPGSFSRYGRITFVLSMSLVADVREFEWGATRPCDVSPSSEVGQHLVSFPSDKGLMVKQYDPAWQGRNGLTEPDRWFCCLSRWEAPVAFCDGSAQLGDYLQFSPCGLPPVVVWQHGVGMPIISPWGGYTARDRSGL